MGRYERQTIIPSFGKYAQEKLAGQSVLIIGAGGLGVPIMQYLVGAGIGKLAILDNDTIDISNIHRQVIYKEEDVGKPKVQVAARSLKAMNELVEIETYHDRLTVKNAESIISKYDIVVDGTDNFSSKFLINDVCVLFNKPLIYGAVNQFEGQVCVLNYSKDNGETGPQLRDVFPTIPQNVMSCRESGVLGTITGIVGTIMSHEVIKVATGVGSSLSGYIMIIDPNENEYRKLKIKKKEHKPVLDISSIDYSDDCELYMPSISMKEYEGMRRTSEEILLIDVRERDEFEAFNIGGINVPLTSLEQWIAENDIIKEKVVVCCQSGMRSSKACQILTKIYSSNVIYNLRSGIGKLP